MIMDKYNKGMKEALADYMRPNMDIVYEYESAAVREYNGVRKDQQNPEE